MRTANVTRTRLHDGRCGALQLAGTAAGASSSPLIAGPASITAAMLLMGQAGADLLKIAVFFLMLLIGLAIT